MAVFNDADAVAAGIAATRGQMDRQVRVWTIGNGIGFGRYPYTEGPWEGGHTVVTLDPKRNLLRLRRPRAPGRRDGAPRHAAALPRYGTGRSFRRRQRRATSAARTLWSAGIAALAAATASQIHLEGPGRFYFTGRDIQRLELPRLKQHLYEMIKMSPLQNYTRRSAARGSVAGRDRRGCGGVGREQVLKVTRRN